jgi:predicted metal-dependent phosphotriesterase family hydrolase
MKMKLLRWVGLFCITTLITCDFQSNPSQNSAANIRLQHKKPIPGYVITTNGEIESSALGFTLPHEHLLIYHAGGSGPYPPGDSNYILDENHLSCYPQNNQLYNPYIIDESLDDQSAVLTGLNNLSSGATAALGTVKSTIVELSCRGLRFEKRDAMRTLSKKMLPDGTETGARIFFTDVNGDGLDDLVMITGDDSYNPGWIYVSLCEIGTGYKTFSWNSGRPVITDRSPVYFTDVNGDNKNDLVSVCKTDGFMYVAYGNNEGFGKSLNEYFWNWTSQRIVIGDVSPVYFTDVNGDGKNDVVAVSKSNGFMYVAYCKNGGFGEAPSAYFWNWTSQRIVIGDGSPVYFTDVNGDGKNDVVAVSKTNGFMYVAYCKNGGFGEATNAYFWNWTSQRIVIGDVSPVYFTDVNGDGKNDVVAISKSNGFMYVAYCKNGGFGNSPNAYFWDWYSQRLVIGNSSPVYFTDVNSDGKNDLVAIGTDGLVYVAYCKNGGFGNSPNAYFWDWYSQRFVIATNSRTFLAHTNSLSTKDIISIGAQGQRDEGSVYIAKCDGNGYNFWDYYNYYIENTPSSLEKFFPTTLQKLGNDANVNVILGTGFYKKGWHPEYLKNIRKIKSNDEERIETIKKIMVDDIEVGIDGAVGTDGNPIRAGIIGEIGISNDFNVNVNDDEWLVLMSSVRAQKETGVAVSIHFEPKDSGNDIGQRTTVADLLIDQICQINEISPTDTAKLKKITSRFIFGHFKPTDLDDNNWSIKIKAILEKGFIIAFDGFSSKDSINELVKIKILFNDYKSQILFSQDICSMDMVKHQDGKSGYSTIVDEWSTFNLVFSAEELEKICCQNPKDVLTINFNDPILLKKEDL